MSEHLFDLFRLELLADLAPEYLMRGAMPNEESVILLMGKTAMDKKSYLSQVPRIDLDKDLFPDE